MSPPPARSCPALPCDPRTWTTRAPPSPARSARSPPRAELSSSPRPRPSTEWQCRWSPPSARATQCALWARRRGGRGNCPCRRRVLACFQRHATHSCPSASVHVGLCSSAPWAARPASFTLTRPTGADGARRCCPACPPRSRLSARRHRQWLGGAPQRPSPSAWTGGGSCGTAWAVGALPEAGTRPRPAPGCHCPSCRATHLRAPSSSRSSLRGLQLPPLRRLRTVRSGSTTSTSPSSPSPPLVPLRASPTTRATRRTACASASAASARRCRATYAASSASW
mmetsp:Transcript_429/g.1188  ORF Transcript_429/g.1188 Transcript_429/m.1188 type:complete len:282 (-) Transcript_429:323-1168(-)